MKPDEIMEMAYPRKYVENIIIGLEDPLNEHLVKLIGFDFPTEQRAHFRREVRTWLSKIRRLRTAVSGTRSWASTRDTTVAPGIFVGYRSGTWT